MDSWQDIREELKECSSALQFHRIDYQWGSAGTHYHLAGGASSHYTRRFESVCEYAGEKLLELPEGMIDESVLNTRPSLNRWYEALKRYSGEYQNGFVATEKSGDGELLGHIYTGSLSHPIEASRNLALKFSTVKLPEAATLIGKINAWLSKEASNRKYFWGFLGFVVFVVLGVLAL